MRLAVAQLMRVAAKSTTIPVTNAAVEEYANTSLRTLATHLFAICAGSFDSTSAPWRKREIPRIGSVKWS
jgi:hypothetical protein